MPKHIKLKRLNKKSLLNRYYLKKNPILTFLNNLQESSSSSEINQIQNDNVSSEESDFVNMKIEKVDILDHQEESDYVENIKIKEVDISDHQEESDYVENIILKKSELYITLRTMNYRTFISLETLMNLIKTLLKQ